MTCLVALVFTGLMLYTTPITWCYEIPLESKFPDLLTLSSFETLLLIGLIVTLYLFIINLKRDQNAFYRDYRCSIWSAVLVLTVPLFLSILSLIYLEYSFRHWKTGKTLFKPQVWNIIYFWITFAVQSGQCATLVFGVLRY